MNNSLRKMTAEVLKVLPREKMSRALGKLASWQSPDLKIAKPLHEIAIQAFIKAYGVNMEEAIVPKGGFSSFNDFFTRKLKQGVRPIDENENHIVSPADGSLEGFGFIEEGEFSIKGQTYKLADLLEGTLDRSQVGLRLGDAHNDRRRCTNSVLRGENEDVGPRSVQPVTDLEEPSFDSFFTVYLSPKDYHRVHAPVSGVIKEVRHIQGNLYPVNSIGVDHIPQLFVQNERVVFVQENSRFGQVVTIMVGAMFVGKMSVMLDSTLKEMFPTIQTHIKSDEFVEKGSEIGTFSIGSTAIVLFPSHPTLDFAVRNGQSIKMGQKIAAMG